MDNTRLHITNRISAYKRLLMRFMCLLAFASSSTMALHSQCTLACNDQLEINLNQDGFFVVTLPILFQGNLANCPNLGVELYDENFNFLGNTLTCAQVGTTVTARTVNYDNNTYCETDLNVVDKTSPQFICPEIFIPCNAPMSPDSIGYPSVNDNCTEFENSDLAFFDQAYDMDCLSSHNGNVVTARIERTWLVEDESGNQGQCVQFIYLLRSTLNDVVFPDHLNGAEALTCGTNDPNDLALTGKPLIEGGEIEPGGYCEISILYSDQVFNTCGGGTTTIRKWLALDVCTNSTQEFDQIIELRDKIGPGISCPADIIVSANSFTCDASILLPTITGTDECSDFTITPSWQFGIGHGPYDGVPAGEYTVTYRAIDACDNSTVCAMVVNIVDNTPPTPICENSISVSLLPSGVARIFASTFDEGSFDNCALDRIQVRRGAEPFNDFVEFYCEDVTDIPSLVQLRVYDNFGLFNDCWIEVTVKDFFGPNLTCPANKTIDCQDELENLALLGVPLYSDACGIDTVYYEDTESLDCGVGLVQRLWTAVDVHGNSSTCQQSISILDNAVLDITYPENITVDFCSGTADTSFTGSPVISGIGCKNVLTNIEDQNFSSSAFCYTIFRTWTVINWCIYDPNSGSNEGEYTHVQRIDVIDNTAPVFTCPADTLVLNFSNDCSTTYVNLSISDATDCSGLVSIQNNSPYSDSSNGDASGFYPNGVHVIEYTAFDNCGNATVCEQMITVKDGLSPNLICKSGVVIEMTQNGAIFIDPSFMIASVSDNCTPANLLTFTLSPNTFTCADIGLQNVMLTATDLEGNATICNTSIEVQDNMFSCGSAEIDISGRLLNVRGNPIANMEVVANGVFFTTTDANGFYTLPDLPAGEDYIVTVSDIPVERSGISTFDMVLIVAHILQTRKIVDPYKIIAIDVDNSNSVSISDIVAIRQLILERIDQFPAEIAWKFVDANFVFTDSTNPFLDNYPREIVLGQLNNDVTNADFLAVKLGDIDGDGASLNGGHVEQRYMNNHVLKVENDNLNAGEVREIEFKIGEAIETFGLQFDLFLNPEYIIFEDLVSDSELTINKNNFIYDEASGRLKFTWNTQASPQKIVSNQSIFSLKVSVHKDCDIDEVIEFLQKSIAPEIYDEQYRKQSLSLSFTEVTQNVKMSKLVLSQNFPNPVVDETTIEIYSEAYLDAQILFVDAKGEEVMNKEIHLVPGNNSLVLQKPSYRVGSFLFYSLMVDGKVTDTKKMLFL